MESDRNNPIQVDRKRDGGRISFATPEMSSVCLLSDSGATRAMAFTVEFVWPAGAAKIRLEPASISSVKDIRNFREQDRRVLWMETIDHVM